MSREGQVGLLRLLTVKFFPFSVWKWSKPLRSSKFVLSTAAQLNYILKSEQNMLPTVADCPMSRSGNSMQSAEAKDQESSAGVEFPLDTNQDVMVLLVELLSNQHAFFAGVSKEWRTLGGTSQKPRKQ